MTSRSSRRRKRGDEEDEPIAPPTKKGKASVRNPESDVVEEDGRNEEVEDDLAPRVTRAAAPKKRILPADVVKEDPILLQADTELATLISEVLLMNNPAMRNARRIARKLQDMKAFRLVKSFSTNKSQRFAWKTCFLLQ